MSTLFLFFRCVIAIIIVFMEATVTALPSSSSSSQKPHIILILADDYGWANLGAHRTENKTKVERQAQREAFTPNIDRLIQEGILLERHYAYKICSPSRSSLQSGRLPVHVNTVNADPAVYNKTDPVSGYAGIPRNMTGIAEKLRAGGYATGMVGKWDAGMATPQHTPWGRGYDEWYGYYHHANDYWTKGVEIEATGGINNCLNTPLLTDLSMHNATYRGGVLDARALDSSCKDTPSDDVQCYEESLFLEQGLRIIDAHNSSAGPLFYHHAFHLVHTPLQVPREYLKKADEHIAPFKFDDMDRRLYSAMVHYMDDAVGALRGALEERSMWTNTVLVFLTDNGGPIYTPGAANNHPLKGGKFSDWEGGVRTNAFVAGGAVPEGRRGGRFHGVLSIADWYGVFCQLAGVDPTDARAAEANTWLRSKGLPELAPVDYIPGLWDMILTNEAVPAQQRELHLSENAVLAYPYKLVTGQQPYSGWTGALYPNCSGLPAPSPAEVGKPWFTHLDFFGRSLPVSPNNSALAAVSWSEDCSGGCLFDVRRDPSEHRDLSREPAHAATLARLQGLLARLNERLFEPPRGEPSAEACLVALHRGGYYGPFVDADAWYTGPVPARSLARRAKDAAYEAEMLVLNQPAVVAANVALARKLVPTLGAEIYNHSDSCLPTNGSLLQRTLAAAMLGKLDAAPTAAIPATRRPSAPRPPIPGTVHPARLPDDPHSTSDATSRTAQSRPTSAAAEERWRSPRPVPDPALDCALRQLAFDKAQELIGSKRGRMEAVADALQLSSCFPDRSLLPSTGTLQRVASGSKLAALSRKGRVGAASAGGTADAAGEQPAIQVFASPTGSDSSSGRSLGAAVRTLARARDVVREARGALPAPPPPAVVHLRGGTYYMGLTGGLQLAAQDSDITFTSWAGEAAVLSGGVLLELHLEPASGDEGRFSGREGVCAAALPAAVEGWRFEQLFEAAGGAPLLWAREPNGDPFRDLQPDGYALAAGNINGTLPDPHPAGRHVEIDGQPRNSSVYPVFGKDFDPRGPAVWYTEGGAGSRYARNHTFWNGTVSGGLRWNATGGRDHGYNVSGFDARGWPEDLGGEGGAGPLLHAFQRAFWGNQQWRLRRLHAPSRTFTFSEGGWQVSRPLGVDSQPFYVEGVAAALDAPGEFWADFQHRRLYLLPNRTAPSGERSGSGQCEGVLSVVAPRLVTLVSVEGAAGLRLVDLSFRHSARSLLHRYDVPSPGDWSIFRGGTVLLQNATGCEIRGCAFNRTGSNAVFLSDRVRGTLIADNDFVQVGDSAIATVGTLALNDGVSVDTYPRDTVITGNHISGVGIWGKQTSALFSAVSCNTSFVGNVVYNGPRAGINLNDGFCGGHNISANVVFNWVRETQDHGPINTWSRENTHRPDPAHPGQTTEYPGWNHIGHNFIMNGPSGNRDLGNLFPCIDNDDGSAHYYISRNVCVYGGFKNYLGQDKIWDENLLVYPGRWSGDACLTAWGGPGHIFRRNKCVTDGGSQPIYLDTSIGGTDTCKFDFGNQTVMRNVAMTYSNTYYTSTGNFSLECGEAVFTLGMLQAHGWEVNTRVGRKPPRDAIVNLARDLISPDTVTTVM